MSVPAASAYIDPGATATDDVSGDVTAAIVVDNQVNTAVVGTYQVRYSVADRAGNVSSTVIRTVTVGAATGGGGGGGAWTVLWLALLGVALVPLGRRKTRA